MPFWGLSPGADGAAIERAYKLLIKQHHPDREGGDASRAAEITQAYRELRGGKAAADPLQFNEFAERRPRPRWPVAALVAGGAIAALLLTLGPSVPLIGEIWASKAPMRRPPSSRGNAARSDVEMRCTLSRSTRRSARPVSCSTVAMSWRSPGKQRMPAELPQQSRNENARPLRGVRRCGGRASGP